MKILVTGGGTGGHLYPALAVAEALKTRIGVENILFLGSNHGMESREVPEEGYAFRGLESVGFPRRPGLQLARAVRAGISAVRAARGIITEFQPDVVFSTGGYASAPVVLAAWLAHVPIVLHEQNSIPGRANRIASRKAERVFLGFSSARRFFPRRDHLRLSGNPLREQVVTGSRARAVRQFRLEEGRKTILVLGGSQGAHSINQAIVDALGYFGEREDVQFLIQSGQRDHEWMVERCREQKAKSWVRRFIPNMGDAYEVADLVVARAGAMTISELAACGLPSILVPYPHAMDDHQMLNADQLREGGAAILVEDRFLNGKDLHDQIVALIEDTIELRKMAMNARRMARPDATREIATALLQYGGEALIPTDEERDDRRGPGSRGRDSRGADRGRRDGWTAPGGRATREGGWRDEGEPGSGTRDVEVRTGGGRRPGGRDGGPPPGSSDRRSGPAGGGRAWQSGAEGGRGRADGHRTGARDGRGAGARDSRASGEGRTGGIPAAVPPPGRPAPGRPAPGAPASGGPVSGGPVSGGPVSGGPVSGGPVSGGPVSSGPVSSGPHPGLPAERPTNEARVEEGATRAGNGREAPATEQPLSIPPLRPAGAGRRRRRRRGGQSGEGAQGVRAGNGDKAQDSGGDGDGSGDRDREREGDRDREREGRRSRRGTRSGDPENRRGRRGPGDNDPSGEDA